MLVSNMKLMRSWSICWLFLLKLFQEVNFGVAWKLNGKIDIIEAYCMQGRVSIASHPL